ncbi:anti-sigma factor [Alteromonas profundi]|nr:anti-sigma factor [Alteromonas profundi]
MMSDEKLSAFLDAELNHNEMEEVREALANTPSLADRLAALAQVDMVVKQAAELATRTPLPAEIVSLLSSEKPEHPPYRSPHSEQASNISPIGQQRNKIKKWTVPLSLAAGIAAVAGLSYMQLSSSPSNENNYWASVSAALDTAHSGETITLTSGLNVTPKLSFQSTTEGLCRQAELAGQDELNVVIACKNQQGNWQLQATKILPIGQSQGQYQTASASKVLEQELDELMASAPFNRVQEATAIKQQWQETKVVTGENDEN